MHFKIHHANYNHNLRSTKIPDKGEIYTSFNFRLIRCSDPKCKIQYILLCSPGRQLVYFTSTANEGTGETVTDNIRGGCGVPGRS